MTGVSLEIYRAVIGYFHSHSILVIRTHIRVSFRTLLSFLCLSLFLLFLVLLSGNIHLNPGPRQLSFSMARSLNSTDKLNEISALTLDYKLDIFAVSETWLNANVVNDSIRIPGYYAPLRKDRVFGRGGGVALYIASHMSFARRFDFELHNLELLWTEFVLGKFTNHLRSLL